MDWLKYIFFLGVVITAFDLIWWAFRTILRMIDRGAQPAPAQALLLRLVSWYLLVAMCALKTREIAETTESFTELLPFTIIGGFAILLTLIQRATRAATTQGGMRFRMPQIQVNPVNWKLEAPLIALALGYFVAAVEYEHLASNPVTNWFFEAVHELYDTPVIGWIIGIIGFFFLVRVLLESANVLGRILNGGQRPQRQRNAPNGFDDFEVVEDEEGPEPPRRSLDP